MSAEPPGSSGDGRPAAGGIYDAELGGYSAGPEETGPGADPDGWPAAGGTAPPRAPTPGPGPAHRSRRPVPAPRRRLPRSRRARRRRILAGLVATLAVIVVLAAIGLVWAAHQIDPGGKPGRAVTVTIPKGSSTARIGRILASAGVIHDATLFRLYAKVNGSGALRAGTYRLATNESYGSAIAKLEAGAAATFDTLVIPEGFTLHEIAARVAALPGMHISAASFLAVSSRGSVTSPYEPRGKDDLEGLVFPATYDISRQDTAADVMTELVQTFDQRAQSIGLTRAATRLGMTPYQLVTVASIVQAEAKFADQFPDTASVLYNRLKDDMTLGADSTLIYALRQTDPNLNLSTVNYEQPSPYNTRLNPGLPPTPIDSPGLPALSAATGPPSTDLLYFVEIDQDGKLGFASTSAGFDQLVAECTATKTC